MFVLLNQMCKALVRLGFNQNSSAVLTPAPWLRMEEAEAVVLKLKHDVMPWVELEEALGIEPGSVSASFRVPPDNVEQPTTAPPNAGDNSGLDVGVTTPAAVGPDTGLVAGMVDEPSHGSVQDSPPPSSDLSLSEQLSEAIAAGIIKTGTLVHLRTSPIAFLREVPVLHDGCVDEFSLRLAEYGARLGRACNDRHRNAAGLNGRPKAKKRGLNRSLLWSKMSKLWSKMSKDFASFQQ